MRQWRRAGVVVLVPSFVAGASAKPTPAPTPAWKATGSGTDTTLTLEAPSNLSQRVSVTDTLGKAKELLPKLVLKCHDRKPMVGVFIGDLNEDVAIVRFDSEPAFEVGLRNRVKWGKLWMWSTVVDPDTMFFDKGERIAASLLAHKKMLVRVTPARQPSLDVTFELPKLEPQLPPFEQACNLKTPIARPSSLAAAPAPPAPSFRPEKPSPARLEKFGGWSLSLSTSKIDDRPIVLLSLPQSKESTATPYASLVLRCREQETEAFLSFDRALPGFLAGSLAVRASADGPEVDEWWLAPSTDRRAYFFSSPPRLLKRLLASQRLKLAYRPRKHPENHPWMPEGEAVFALSGLDRASKAFLEACPIDLAKVKVKDGLAKLP